VSTKTNELIQAKSLVLLTAALVMIATWAVGATGWVKGINIVTFIGLGVILIGMMLVRSILPGFVAHIFSIIIGLGWSFWVTSKLLPAHYTWLERWQNLAFRLSYWYSQATQGGTSYDNLMFILQMNIIVWAMGYLTIWFVFRSGRVWQAVIPGGLVLLINLYYAPKDITFWFILYVLLSLLLVVRFNLLSQESKWRAEGVFFRPDISFDFLRDGFIFSLLVVGLAWLTPPVAQGKTLNMFDEVQGRWRDLQSEWNRLYADLNYRSTRTVGTFGQSLTLGGPRRLTDEPVMDVKPEGLGRYWRAVVYDEYTGVGWRSNDRDSDSFGPRRPLSLPIFEARQIITQTYTLYRDGSTILYAMSNPISLDRSARVNFRALSGEQVQQTESLDWLPNGEPWVEEVTYIRSNATVDSDESYQVLSWVSKATIEQLQSAGTDYPAWTTDRYLQLPDTITNRTQQLARDLTEAYDNPYDKAAAIERYLRSELTYNEQMAAPPPGVDKVDYVLFEGKEAYCDYYASSMIVMLRSLGIPARMAAGFARGTYDSELNAFHVVNADAHSWVEIFFPHYGWIEFEPTAAQPVIIRPTSLTDAAFAAGALPNEGVPERDNLPDRPGNIPIDDENVLGGPFTLNLSLFGSSIKLPVSVAGGSVLVLGGIVLALLVASSLWWRQQSGKPTDNISGLYQRMVRLANWMGITMRPWQTPYEHAAMLERSLPARQHEVHTIATEYVHQLFSPHPIMSPPNGRVIQNPATVESYMAWGRLRGDMLKAALKRRLPRRLRRP
jgi:transglutaminase-like putative cysteine protease